VADALVAQKGPGPERLVVLGGYEVRTPIIEGQSACQGLALAARYALARMELGTRLAGCQAGARWAFGTITARELSLELTAVRVWRSERYALAAGLALGSAVLAQAFETTRVAPTRVSAGGRGGLHLELSRSFGSLLAVLTVAGEGHLFNQLESSSRTIRVVLAPGLRAGLGLGHRW
jgi:hypothetical protein